MIRFLAPLWLVVTSACAQSADMTPEQLTSRLVADLPVGTDAETVAAYVNDNDLTSDGPVSPAQLAATEDGQGAFDLLAIKRDVRQSALTTTALQMRFIFDEGRKLTRISVREVHTGL